MSPSIVRRLVPRPILPLITTRRHYALIPKLRLTRKICEGLPKLRNTDLSSHQNTDLSNELLSSLTELHSQRAAYTLQPIADGFSIFCTSSAGQRASFRSGEISDRSSQPENYHVSLSTSQRFQWALHDSCLSYKSKSLGLHCLRYRYRVECSCTRTVWGDIVET